MVMFQKLILNLCQCQKGKFFHLTRVNDVVGKIPGRKARL